MMGMVLSFSMWAQNRTITGQVFDEKAKTPLAGVSVTVKGSKVGTTTGNDGSFKIEVPSSAKILVFSYVGFDLKEVVIGSSTSFAVQLAEAQGNLEEVVVVA